MRKTTKVYPDELMEVMEMYASDGEITGDEELAVVNKAVSLGLDPTEVKAYFEQMAKNVAQNKAKVPKNRTNFFNKKFFVGAIVLVAIGFCVCLFGNKAEEPQKNSFADVPKADSPKVEVPVRASLSEIKLALKSRGIIYGEDYVLTKTIEYKDESDWGKFKSLFGNKAIELTMSATFRCGIDLSKLEKVEINGGTVSITLPHPFIKYVSANLDDVSADKGFLRSDFTEAQIDAALDKAWFRILNSIKQEEVVDPTTAETIQILNSMLEDMGYERVYVFEAQKNYSKAELEDLVVK